MLKCSATLVAYQKGLVVDVNAPVLQRVSCDDLNFLVARVSMDASIFHLKFHLPLVKLGSCLRAKRVTKLKIEDLLNYDQLEADLRLCRFIHNGLKFVHLDELDVNEFDVIAVVEDLEFIV